MDMLLEEIESLEAILMDDCTILRHPDTDVPESVETTIFPLVGDDTDSYVCVTLVVELVPGYPEVRPAFKLKNPRGLCDSTLNVISRNINAKLDESLGSPVVFDLIDVVREHLTDSNVPSGQCVICLYGFQESDHFTKTQCFHYMHTYCLVRHLDASKRNYQEEFNKLPGWQQLTAKPYQPACPVCREPIECDRAAMEQAPQPRDLATAPGFRLTEEIRCLQSKMAHLYLHQKERGGIIDDTEEPQILAIVDPREEAAERERARQREVERAEAALAAAEAEKAAQATKKTKKNNSHYEHKHKDHHHHHKKGHHHQYHRSHNHHHHHRHGAATGETQAPGTSDPVHR